MKNLSKTNNFQTDFLKTKVKIKIRGVATPNFRLILIFSQSPELGSNSSVFFFQNKSGGIFVKFFNKTLGAKMFFYGKCSLKRPLAIPVNIHF